MGWYDIDSEESADAACRELGRSHYPLIEIYPEDMKDTRHEFFILTWFLVHNPTLHKATNNGKLITYIQTNHSGTVSLIERWREYGDGEFIFSLNFP